MPKYRAEKDALIHVEFDTLDELDAILAAVEGHRGEAYIGLLDNCTLYLNDGSDEEIDEDDIA